MKYYEFTEVHNFQTSVNEKEHFWHAINLWNERPNLINKRLIGCEVLFKFQLKDDTLVDEISNILLQQFLNEVLILTATNVSDYISKTFKERLLLECDCDDSRVVFYIKQFLHKFVPTDSQHSNIEIAILDYENGQATFFNNLSNDNSVGDCRKKLLCYSYRIKFEQNLKKQEDNKSSCIKLLVNQEQNNVEGDDNTVSVNNDLEWLKTKLLPKIVRWVEQTGDSDITSSDLSQLNRGSLNLININDYCVLYQKLKEKYGKAFVKIWPENTDPLKFVYEDVAIACYLILLWRHKKQNFIDLGCGNGLLVHILTSEGHNGLGIDVRPRKIWDLYPEGTANLQVKAFVPTLDDSCLYPDADWLIGNHSDELTPWIPVLATMSSYNCKFFLLPCCSYELNGDKYQRQNSSKSQYMDYLDHIKKLCGYCGFNAEFDKLRIPSTKRICIIGDIRSYSLDDHTSKVTDVRSLIASKCCLKDESIICANTSASLGYSDFKPRSNEIKVRNCTQLDKNFVCDLVALIAKKLLDPSLSPPLVCHSNNSTAVLNEKSQWNEGSPIALSDLAKSLPDFYLKKLKKECGGLQTLIRNHHFIFKIDKGSVVFRKPLSVSSHRRDKITTVKAKRCWFFDNHPDKCPLTSDDCPYMHS